MESFYFYADHYSGCSNADELDEVLESEFSDYKDRIQQADSVNEKIRIFHEASCELAEYADYDASQSA